MYIIFPLAPLMIAALVLILLVLCGFYEYLNTISNIIWVVLTIIFAGFLLCNIFWKFSENKVRCKLIGAGITVAAATIAMFTTKMFLVDVLAEVVANEIVTKDYLSSLIEFAFDLLVGGAIWFFTILLCICAPFNYLDDDGGFPPIPQLIGGMLLCVLFYFLSRP